MNFSKQLKIYRERDGLSQEELAEKIYVTRQTISKWENDHTYPDIHNLIALSTLFEVSLDELIKGDVENMRQTIGVAKFNKHTGVMFVFMIMTVISIVPLMDLWGWYGVGISLVFWVISMVAALKIEKMKKMENIQTYAEILAFTEGKNIQVAREKRDKKRDRVNKIKIVLVFTLTAAIICLISVFIWNWFFR
ncbi:helix-turn-helix domain-containing protein [Brochothrix thermosphacta]|uniref:XRE family transcriptional regulator n=1 Tax=Brochothrix thermosphacta TaxID=2756 RepID=A0A1D2L0P0_BROTH|nr:helix-turn-helix transcriptional regulator [Brochothrix thermosphacta]ATF25031.1 XRE family transcriptional regulator [Brochothrix thermosphacta]ATH84447.1 XRE family transcriptional regulator [Brochothrix thermosphacta]MPQ29771.1 XRE family transcriptional regulator [Brochothrix thermosphacta]ODJ63539.1 transcriptional regulator [Brochothrix thermosphacta]ODJ72735.1 transcriptional regulator [Brochothrix thermosphacta]